MIHGYKGRTSKQDKGEIRGYPYKNEYKYLGIFIDKNLTLKQQLEYTREKIKKGMKIIYMMFKRDMKEWRKFYV